MSRHEPISTPSFYNDLDLSLQQAWRLLTTAAVDRKAAMHTPVVATLGADGQPKARVVVLRQANANDWTLRFHTDRRSLKIAELTAHPQLQIVAYHPAEKIQLRISGNAHMHSGDAEAAAAWAQSQAQSQLCYRQAMSPGAIASDPATTSLAGDSDGAENFAAVVVAIREIEWLYLAHTGHRRARFSREADGFSVSACWLAP